MENQNPPTKPWYKKKRYYALLVVLGLVAIANTNGNSPTPESKVNKQTSAVVESLPGTNNRIPTHEQILRQPEKDKPASNVNGGLSNDNYYTNTYGNRVHSPAYSESVPVGATARCRDGTYSFSQSRRGTCSHHGGVVDWL